MKRIVTDALVFAMIVLAAAGSLCAALTQRAFDEQLYSEQSRAAVADALGVADAVDADAQTTACIGMTPAQQDVFARDIVAFLRGETDEQPAALNGREQQHMLDVRRLIRLAQQAAQLCMTVAAGLCVMAAWTGARDRRGLLPGTAAGLLLVAACAGIAAGLLRAQGFEALFVRMHEIAFDNDLWLLDPQTDVLIRMMPQQLFERAAKDAAIQAAGTFAIVWALLCALYRIVGGMIRRNLTEREKQ